MLVQPPLRLPLRPLPLPPLLPGCPPVGLPTSVGFSVESRVLPPVCVWLQFRKSNGEWSDVGLGGFCVLLGAVFGQLLEFGLAVHVGVLDLREVRFPVGQSSFEKSTGPLGLGSGAGDCLGLTPMRVLSA